MCNGVSRLFLGLALGPRAWAQQQAGRPRVNRPRIRPAEGQRKRGAANRNQTAAETETIRGVIAAITAEGEVMLDYRTNTAARTEAAFLTVVGSPMKSDGRRPGIAGQRRPRTTASACEPTGIATTFTSPG